MEGGSQIFTSAVLLCADSMVELQEGSMVRTDGRGCPANNGDAPGQQPLLGGSSYRSALLSGGSGGGNGGAGGVSGVSPASAITYATQIAGGTGMENYPESGQAISAGSGGGAGTRSGTAR